MTIQGFQVTKWLLQYTCIEHMEESDVIEGTRGVAGT
jgi:hypothetical protein